MSLILVSSLGSSLFFCLFYPTLGFAFLIIFYIVLLCCYLLEVLFFNDRKNEREMGLDGRSGKGELYSASIV